MTTNKIRGIYGLGAWALVGLLLHCVPGLPPGTKICSADADCSGGEVCAIKVCRPSCDPRQSGSCPTGESCQPLPNGKSACGPGTSQPPPPTTGTGKEGETCAKTGCVSGLRCGQAPHEADFFCRSLCDVNKAQCPEGHFCGGLTGTNDAICFPKAAGSVDEFGKCSGTFGECKNNALNLVCVIDPKREPAHGFCLRACESDGSCRSGYHCIQTVKACGESCDLAKDQCSYGSCRQLSSNPQTPVCF